MKQIFTTLIALLLVQSVFACSASFGWYSSPTSHSALNFNFYNTSTFGSSGLNSALLEFGDGASGNFYSSTGSLSHAYSTPGTYTAMLILTNYDSATGTVICSDTMTQSITVSYSPCVTTVDTSVSGDTVTLTCHTPAGTAGMTYTWDFGDGTTGSGSPVTHVYATHGIHYPSLVAYSGTAGCLDSVFLSVTTGTGSGSNDISGYIINDSVGISTDTFTYKIWLITYDSATHIIQTVDSETVSSALAYTVYSFSGVPSGSYLVKAYIINSPASTVFPFHIPTYHDSSAYWGSAPYVLHTSGISNSGVNIWLKRGAAISGPGFIAGNVLYGAGKTTGGAVGSPVVGLLIYLRDAKNNIIASAYTDASGNYEISNIPYGTYSIYPEGMGYKTTAWSSIDVTSANPHVNGINFSQNSTSIKPATTAVAYVASSTQTVFVFPNPTTGKLLIQWNASAAKTATVNVTNIAGQVVYSTQLNINGAQRNEINLSTLSDGLYFMNILSGGMNYTQKVSIQH
ncbi:MAG: T9SS type A sorting domain-containing protein [Flavipsychrobacter sp.]